MKRWRLFSLCFLFVSVGCTLVSPVSVTSPLPTGTPPPTRVLSPTPTPSPPLDLITLSLWTPDFLGNNESANVALLRSAINAFTRDYADVQVRVLVKKAKGTGGIYNLLSSTAKVAPDLLPDLVILSEVDLQAAAKSSVIHPLDMIKLDRADFYPFAAQGVFVQDTLYGVPFVTQAHQIAYRNWVAVTPPVSWTAVLSNSYSILFPAAPTNGLADDTLVMAYLGSGGAVLDESNNLMLDRAHLEGLYGFFLAAMDRGLLDPEQALTLPDAKSCWEVYLEGTGHLSPVPMGLYWSSAPLSDSNPGWFPTSDGQPATLARLWAFAVVTENPVRQEAAVQFIDWLTDPHIVSEFSKSTGLLPASRQALYLGSIEEKDRMFMKRVLDAASPALPSTVDTKVRQALQAGLDALLQGDVMTPEDAATRALTVLRR